MCGKRQAVPKQKKEEGEQNVRGGCEAFGCDENAPAVPKDHPGIVHKGAERRQRGAVLPGRAKRAT